MAGKSFLTEKLYRLREVIPEIHVLVDYDNLSVIDQSRGLRLFCENILSKINAIEVNNLTKVKFRLYGGWYKGSNLSFKASDLISQIAGNSPRVWRNPTSNISYSISIELARSLLSEPNQDLLNTFRTNEIPQGITCDDPSRKGCTKSSCPINNVYDFFNYSRIKGQCCSLGPKDILKINVQKLVDTMLAIDLYFLAISSKDPIIIVSSDDDFWPSILASSKNGRIIIQIHTIPNYKTAFYYSSIAGINYIQKNLR